ncbi:MAG: CBS domain-containing protein [Planctomycetes bacterium]|nr:CBS domain-containing protein [Planctomycetota bacterium]
MRAMDVMTPRVITVRSDDTVAHAVRIMLQNRISGLPVLDPGGKLVGIVTEGDLLRRVETGTEVRRAKWLEFLLGPGRGADDYVHAHTRKIAEIMTTDVITVGETVSLDDIVRLMERQRIKRVVVMRSGLVVGLITRHNLLQALARVLAEAKPTTASDAAIRESILADMAKLSWAPAASVNVIVRNGVVGLHGVVMDDRQRAALRVLAENTPGVTAVQDELIWVDPTTGWVIEGESQTTPSPPDERAA